MRKAAGAVLYDCIDIKDEYVRYKFCPHGANSWYKWQNDRETVKSEYTVSKR